MCLNLTNIHTHCENHNVHLSSEMQKLSIALDVFKYQWPIWLSWMRTDSSRVWLFPMMKHPLTIPHWWSLYTWEQQALAWALLTEFGLLSWVGLRRFYCSGPAHFEAWRFRRVDSNLIYNLIVWSVGEEEGVYHTLTELQAYVWTSLL